MFCFFCNIKHLLYELDMMDNLYNIFKNLKIITYKSKRMIYVFFRENNLSIIIFKKKNYQLFIKKKIRTIVQ